MSPSSLRASKRLKALSQNADPLPDDTDQRDTFDLADVKGSESSHTEYQCMEEEIEEELRESELSQTILSLKALNAQSIDNLNDKIDANLQGETSRLALSDNAQPFVESYALKSRTTASYNSLVARFLSYSETRFANYDVNDLNDQRHPIILAEYLYFLTNIKVPKVATGTAINVRSALTNLWTNLGRTGDWMVTSTVVSGWEKRQIFKEIKML